MKKVVSELLIERLIEWGVDTIYGLPGDGINGIMEAIRRNTERIRFVLVHHEEAAAFMATGHAKSVRQVASLLGAPIVKTLSGKGCFPDDDPLAVGGIGLLGTIPGERSMEECDTLFMVGTNFPYTKHLPGEARTVQIDISAFRVGNRMPTEVPLVGDARETLAALVPLLSRKACRGRARTG